MKTLDLIKCDVNKILMKQISGKNCSNEILITNLS